MVVSMESEPMTDRTCPLGEDCDLTVAWMAGRGDAEEDLARRAVKLALEEAAKVCTGDETRPARISGQRLRGMSVQEQFAYEQVRMAWVDADAIRALDPDAILARAKGGEG